MEKIVECHGKTRTAGIFFTPKEILFQGRSSYQEILFFRNEEYGTVLFLDGMVMTTERDGFFYHEPLVHPAMTASPLPERVLIVGGGDGGALSEVVKYPEVRSVVMVEIDPMVVELSQKFFPENRKGFSDPRVEIVYEDGKTFVNRTERTFDVVIVDGSDPVGPALPLFEEEFFLGIHRILTEEGIVVTQSENPFFYQEVVKRVTGIFSRLFSWWAYYMGPVPTYPGGLWSWLWGGKGSPPVARRYPPPSLKWYIPRRFPYPGDPVPFQDL
jgi:spermidine synthase